jgi:hypothetical protein
MRAHPLSLPILASFLLLSTAQAQCPDYSSGTSTAGIGIFNGGDEARMIYVDCLTNIAIVEAQFGHPGSATPVDGLPLTIAVWDDPNDDQDPSDAVLVAQVTVPGGVTGGHTGLWQTYDLRQLLGHVVPATGGMFVGVGVRYPAGASPGSIEFFNFTPNTQWLASAGGPTGLLDYSNLGAQSLYNVANVGFPPGSWVMRAQEGASFANYGTGCAGGAGVPDLTAATYPALGTTFTLQVGNASLNATDAFLMIGFSDTSWNGVPLPLTMAGFGMPNCTAYASPDAVLFFLLSGGTGTVSLSLPAAPGFVGTSLYAQALVRDPSAGNALGAVVTNAGHAILN